MEPAKPATEDKVVVIDLADSTPDAPPATPETSPQDPASPVPSPASPDVATPQTTEPESAEPPAPATPPQGETANGEPTAAPTGPAVTGPERARRYAEVLARRLSSNPDQPLVAARLVRLWLEANELAKARGLLLKGPPPDAGPEALAIWASAQISVGEMGAARHSLEKALSKTRSGGGLVLRDLSLCQRVLSYANYEPLTSHLLWPTSTVRLYAELVNANAVLENGQYHLRLRWSLQVLDDQGQAVWTRESQDLLLVSRRPTQDNFVTIPFSPPSSLGRGSYNLELTVIDRSGSEERSTSASIGFELR